MSSRKLSTPERDAKFFTHENAEERKAKTLSRQILGAILKPKRKRKRKGPKHINTRAAAKIKKPKSSRTCRGRPRKRKRGEENVPEPKKVKKPAPGKIRNASQLSFKGSWGLFVKQARKNLGKEGRTILKKGTRLYEEAQRLQKLYKEYFEKERLNSPERMLEELSKKEKKIVTPKTRKKRRKLQQNEA